MPQPAEVTSASDQLLAEYTAAHAELVAEIRAARGGDAARLRVALRVLDAIMGRLDDSTRTYQAQTIPAVFQQGGIDTGLPFVWNAPTSTAVQALADQNYTELLTATRHVTAKTKRALRTLAKAGSLDAVVGGQTANTAGLQATNLVQDAASKVMTVTYANGAEHSLADWADTAVRTQTAKAYNGGALHQFSSYQIEWIELADGPACGLTAHNDPELANGLVVPIDVAEAYPLSHPRCARSMLPRADLNSKTAAQAANDGRDMDALNAQALDERQRAARSTVTGRRMTVKSETARVGSRVRAGRTARPARTPR